MSQPKTYWGLAFLMAAFIVAVCSFKFCDGPAEKTATEPIKKEVQTLKEEKSIVSANSGTISVEVKASRANYRALKAIHDTIIKHDTVLKIIVKACDEALDKDSLLIANQAKEINLSNQIIAKQDTIIHRDSLTISGLKKEVKKQKRLKIFFGVLAAVAAGIGIAR